MRLCLITVTLCISLLASPSLFAATPELRFLHPAGVRRGEAVTVEAGGKFDVWPPQIWTDRSGITVEAAQEKGQLNISTTAQTLPGVYWIRVYNDEGASAQRPFIVGTLPELNEAEPNNDYRKPQELTQSPVLINGRLNGSSDVDTYAVKLAEGQTLVASMTANEVLGSPMDAILEITSTDGFRLGYNHDTFNLDPQLVFTAPAAGTYLVRTFAFPAQPGQSIRYSASSNYVYRLALTTGAFLDHAFPLAISQQNSAEIELRGWNVPEPVRFLKIQPQNENGEFALLFHPLLGNTGRIKIEPHRVTVESAVNDSAHPQVVTLPITISGSISQPREEDWYQFQATKGQIIEFRAESWALGFPLDPLIRITDAAGKRLSQVDDLGGGIRDAKLTYTIPADGEYRLMIRDLHRQGGFRYVYRLSALLPQPDYTLKIDTDTFTLTPGTPLEIPVTIERLHGFAGEIEISAADLPAGVTAQVVKSLTSGETAKSVKLQLTAAAGPASGLFRILGKSGDQSSLTRTAEAVITGFTETTGTPWLTVLKPAKMK